MAKNKLPQSSAEMKFSTMKSYKTLVLTGFLLFSIFNSSLSFGQISGSAGSYLRLGISPKAVALGNAVSASTEAYVFHPYYNPSLIAFNQSFQGKVAFSSLSLDRAFNTASFFLPIGPDANIGFSWIHAGVDNIDGRDSDGYHTKNYSTSENLLTFSFAKSFGNSFGLGISIKGYQASLYDDISSSFSIGYDIGIIKKFELSPEQVLAVAFTIKDINAKYKWDTTPIYNEDGSVITDKLPLSYNFGFSYKTGHVLSLEKIEVVGELSYQTATLEASQTITEIINGQPVSTSYAKELNSSQTLLRLGLHVQPVPYFTLQIGADQLGIAGWDFTEIAKPALGFSVLAPVQNFHLCFDYAYTFEPHSGSGINSLALSVTL